MIKFYQDWCGHCKRMKPDWDRLAEEAPASVFIKDVDCGVESDLCKEHGVQGYPTIMVYKDGDEEKYTGDRSFFSLMEYVQSNLAKQCDIASSIETCSERQQSYLVKWQDKEQEAIRKEVLRLERMKKSIMTPELKQWLKDRMLVLNQLVAPMQEEDL